MNEHENGHTLETWPVEHTTADNRFAREVEVVVREQILSRLARASDRAARVLEEIARRGR